MLTYQEFCSIHKKAVTLKNNYKDTYKTLEQKKEVIQDLIKGTDIDRIDINTLLKKFHIEYKNTKTLKTLSIHNCIYYMFIYFHSVVRYTTNKDKILSAYIYTLLAIEQDRNFTLDSDSAILDNDDINRRCDSIRYFRDKKYKVKLINGEIKFPTISKIAYLLDKELEKLGDFAVYEILRMLKVHANTQIYQFTDYKKEILLPIGFLFNKSLKHFHPTKLPEPLLKANFSKVLEMSKHYISMYGLQRENDISLTMMNSKALVKEQRLPKQLLSDQVFKIEQYDCTSVLAFIEYVKNQYINIDQINYLYELASYISTCEINKPIDVSKKFMSFSTKYGQNIHSEMISLLVNSKANENFKTIEDYRHINYYKKPFLEKLNQEIIFLNHNFFFVGFYYALFEILYRHNEHKKQGDLVEGFAENQVSLIGESMVKGEKSYRVDKPIRDKLQISSKELQSDLIIYNNDYIVFFEIKLRALNNSSKAGNEYSIYEDLTQSLVRSQIQLTKHVRYLITNKSIKFKSGEVLNYNNQKIIRVSVSSLEFLGLTSQLIYKNFLKNAIEGIILDKDITYQNQINCINKYFQEYREETNKLLEIEGTNNINEILVNTKYLSVFQLIYLINRSKVNNTSLIDELTCNLKIILDQTDFYYQYQYLDILKRSSNSTN